MKDINIAAILIQKRKEKSITQEQLADFLRVSKASVSKWETGASYPDISFLPQLATYFDISIDELMDYDPQMNKDQIRHLTHHLTTEITKRPFEETVAEWRSYAKRYYACYPLLLQLGIFMLNNASLAADAEQRVALLQESTTLFKRIRENSSNAPLCQMAIKLEATIQLALQNPDAALELLELFEDETLMPPDLLMAAAHQMKGDVDGAKRIVQIGHFQNLVLQLNYLLTYLPMVINDNDAFEATVNRARALTDVYGVSDLHPFIMLSVDLTCAICYAARGETDRCLETLESYAALLASDKTKLSLHGDAYFDLIDSWLEGLETGNQLPRNTVLVRSDLVDAVEKHPAFASLAKEKRYKALVKKLQKVKKEDAG